MGMDEDVEESHSKQAVPGSHMEDMPTHADWMIRAHVTPLVRGKFLKLDGEEEEE